MTEVVKLHDHSDFFPNFDEIPKPRGWKILALPKISEDISAGGIVLADTTKDANKHLTCVAQVIAMGELCYTDDRFKLGENHNARWCEVGDYIVYDTYRGQKIKYLTDEGNIELLLLNDDEVKAITKAPKRVRAYV